MCLLFGLERFYPISCGQPYNFSLSMTPFKSHIEQNVYRPKKFCFILKNIAGQELEHLTIGNMTISKNVI